MILMLAPASNLNFGTAPSGAAYVSDRFGLIRVANNSPADQAALQNAGCYTLTPFGGWGAGMIDTLADLYAADAVTGLILPGQVGYPRYTSIGIYNDGANSGTWAKTNPGIGAGNWMQVSTSTPISAAISAAASAAAAGASRDQAASAAASSQQSYSLTLATLQALNAGIVAGKPLAITLSDSATTFDTVGLARLAVIPANVTTITVRGYYAPNDGGKGTWKRMPSDTSSSGGASFRSADRFMPDGSTDTVNGGWWILMVVNSLTIEQVGGQADCPTPAAPANYLQNFSSTIVIPPGVTDNSQPLLDAMRLTKPRPAGTVNESGGMLTIYCSGRNDPSFAYYFSKTIVPPYAVRIQGVNTGFDTYPQGSIFVFPANVGAFVINNQNTQPAGYAAIGAGGTVVDGIYCQGGGGTDRTAHAFRRRTPCSFNNSTFDSFAGDGMNNVAYIGRPTTDPGYGLTSGSRDFNITIRAAGNNGAYTEGSDVSASYFSCYHVKSARLAGMIDVGYFENEWPGYQCNGHGFGFIGAVQHLGRCYYLADLTPGIGGTTEPSTNPTVWIDDGPLANPTSYYPAWVSGNTYAVSTPAYLGGSVTMPTPYIEDYYLPIARTQQSNGLVINNGNVSPDMPCLNPDWTTGSIRSNVQLRSDLRFFPNDPVAGAFQYFGIGSSLSSSKKNQLFEHYRDSEGLSWCMQYSGPDMRYGPGFIGSGKPDLYRITGANTANTFGATVPQPFVMDMPRFAVGDYRDGNGSNSRLFRTATNAAFFLQNGEPAAYGQRFWLVDSAPGGFLEKYCTTAGIIGSTAVFKNANPIAA